MPDFIHTKNRTDILSRQFIVPIYCLYKKIGPIFCLLKISFRFYVWKWVENEPKSGIAGAGILYEIGSGWIEVVRCVIKLLYVLCVCVWMYVSFAWAQAKETYIHTHTHKTYNNLMTHLTTSIHPLPISYRIPAPAIPLLGSFSTHFQT